MANAIRAFSRFPEQYQLLRANPSLIKAAFEESLRWDSPSRMAGRIAMTDVQIGDYVIPKGERCGLMFAAANRDPRRWENPDHYDVTRRTSGHVGYGSGIHMCVGQLVARLEGETMLAALARKVASIEITGTVKRRYNNTLRGLESLPITITPA